MSGRRRIWTWADVKYELERHGYSLADVARHLRVTRHAVAKVKNRPSARVQSAMAEIIEVAPAEIWPDRYATRRAA